MDVQTLQLERRGHSYFFRYTPGSENEVIDELMRLADDPDCALDWLDTAELSFQVAQQAAGCCALTPRHNEAREG